MELKITFPDGSKDDSFWVTPLGENLYRAEESTMSMGESEQIIRYGDVIEVELTSEVEGRFKRIVRPSPNESSTHIIRPVWMSTAKWDEFSQRLLNVGGYWEVVFGWLLIAHVPPGAGFDLEQELRQLPETISPNEP
jgi:hypothetical protein